MTLYNMARRKHRLKYIELCDVSNMEVDGGIVDPETPRGHADKVSQCPSYGICLPRLTACRATHYSTLTQPSTHDEQAIRSSWSMNCPQKTLEVDWSLQTRNKPKTISTMPRTSIT